MYFEPSSVGSGQWSSQVNLIWVTLNHSSSLKGLYGPYIYDTPLTLAPEMARIKNSFSINLEKERRVRDSSFQGC